MVCKVLTLILISGASQWSLGDAMTLRKASRVCKKQGKCLVKAVKSKKGIKYYCKGEK